MSQEEGTMNLLILLCVLCVTFTGLCEGFGVVVDDLLNATVGGKVLFTPKLMPEEPPVTISTVVWNFDNRNIIIFSADKNTTTAGYEGRITPFISTGSLELRNLALHDSGEYSVNIITSGATQVGNTRLMIYVKQPPSCNSGCINGIKFACCLLVGLCAGGWYFVSRRRKQRQHLSHGDTTTGSAGGGSQNSLASSRNQDVTYENIHYLKNQDGGTVQLELEKISSSYPGVKVNNRLPAASSTDAHVEQMNEAAPQSGANCAQTYAQDPMT